MKKFFVILVIMIGTLGAILPAMATNFVDPKIGSAEFEECMALFDQIEKNCSTVSLADEQYLNDMLNYIIMTAEAGLIVTTPGTKEFVQLSILEKRARQILAGPCCQRIRILDEVKDLILGPER